MGYPNNKIHPRNSASFLSTIFYLFTFDTFKRGYRKEWTSDNLYKIISTDTSGILGDEIDRRWNKAKKTCSENKTTPSLLNTLLRMFWTELLFEAFLLAIAQIVLRLAEPIILGKLLKYFKEENLMGTEDALRYVLYITSVIGARIIFYSQYKMCTYKTILRARIACTNLVYRKILNLSMTSLQEVTSGQVMNFISYDLSRFDFGADLVHFIWVAPVFVLSIIYIMYVETGLCGLVGVLWFSLVAILQSFNGNLTASLHRQVIRKSDNRLRIMNEIISGIQVIKMYAWEKCFARNVHQARAQELDSITKLNYVRNIFLSFSSICNHLALFFTIGVIIWMKDNITSAKVYGLVVYYGVLNFVVSIMFILAISKSVEMWRTIKRLNDFLLKEEYFQIPNVDNPDNNTIIQMDDVEARWNSSTSLYNFNLKFKKSLFMKQSEMEALINKLKNKTVLHNINLALKQGNLIGIIGPVGSGKSSLLQALLGELELISGSMKVQRSVAYASQDAWTFAGTIRENIIFGQEFDENRYKEVVRVCGLERDFELFPNGDATEVGDRGASLSGGQKSRINLARAVYRIRNIYLLDDPLSAVDVQVAQHIYKECIEGFLKNKCRILVTHHVYYLKSADYVIVLNQGSIQDSGTYAELLSRGSISSNVISDNNSTPEQIIDLIDNLASNVESVEKVEGVKESAQVPVRSNSNQKHHLRYFLKSTNWQYFMFIFFLFFFAQFLLSLTDFFLSAWVNSEEYKNNTNPSKILKTFHVSIPTLETVEYLYVYGGLIVAVAVCNLFKSIFYVNFFRKNSKRLHDNMFSKVINASMEFFDCESSGHIINRFSRDLQASDEFVPRTITESLMFVNSLLAAVTIVLLLNPYIIIMVAVMTFTFISISYFFMRTSRNMKEVESSLMSPILTLLNETMQGLITIRGLDAQIVALKKFSQFLDRYTSSWYMLSTVFAAFGFYIEFVCFLFISVVTTTLILLGRDLGLTASEVGLAITQSMVLSAIVQYGVLNCAQINNLLVSVGRILEYNNLPQERDPEKPIIPPTSWPVKGEIVFKNVNLMYSSCQHHVLKNLNFVIKPSEKVGIVGRTGAGKSSLISALFRLAKIEGLIEIDGINTGNLSLSTIRSKLSIIPQDPVLFNGTLRYNLDPFDEYDDNELYEALKSVELTTTSGEVKSLSTKVRDRGSNYSVGQRQLICLARAIIRKNRIVILDEATANVDVNTDVSIQKTMKKQFCNCTVLTVAHRLSTVISCDKILVIDAGNLVEIGHPYILLNNTQGRFYSMVSQTGAKMTNHLRNLAMNSYQEMISGEKNQN